MADPVFERLKLAFLRERWILIDKTAIARQHVGMTRTMLTMESLEQLDHPNYIFYFSYDRMVHFFSLVIISTHKWA
jgi:hypothetical protein